MSTRCGPPVLTGFRLSTRARLMATLLGLVTVLLVLVGCGADSADQLRGAQREPLPDVRGPSLPDATNDGQDFEFVAEDDGLLLVYFGYTSCPDVCPTTLADARQAIADVGPEQAARVDLAMVTIDPERDTSEVLSNYVQSFHHGSHALVTDDDDRLREAADAFGASYNVSPTENGEPEVSHTGFLYAVDDRGKLVVTWPFGTPSADLAHDIDVLLSQQST